MGRTCCRGWGFNLRYADCVSAMSASTKDFWCVFVFPSSFLYHAWRCTLEKKLWHKIREGWGESRRSWCLGHWDILARQTNWFELVPPISIYSMAPATHHGHDRLDFRGSNVEIWRPKEPPSKNAPVRMYFEPGLLLIYLGRILI